MDATARSVERGYRVKTKVVLMCGLLTVLMCIASVLAGCAMSREKGSGDSYIQFYVDPETKVEYVMYYGGYAGGICPRYNPDGSLYIKEE